ncbi:hypothetical protein BKA62DRAFT_430342 [Auriculariales sp. MPI-PUGE-AT-0066]|nr:hypothetical protein BKA62DRAFT_430342 [Auriculariales sp. MPI-PUGE-AT-0066]
MDVDEQFPFSMELLSLPPPNLSVVTQNTTETTETNGITLIEAEPVRLDQAASNMLTGYFQVWGSLQLWGRGQIPAELVRNAISRMRNLITAFQLACDVHNIDASDMSHYTNLLIALAEHCLTQPQSTAVTETFGEMLRREIKVVDMHQAILAKVELWRAKTQPATVIVRVARVDT